MFASSPPVAPLEHPVYDLRVETEPFDRDPPKGSS
jgi:hypothetical protein